jgi:hypothetical protein
MGIRPAHCQRDDRLMKRGAIGAPADPWQQDFSGLGQCVAL